MQKQVEVRMDESHLGPGVDPPENPCGTLCDKIMKNMVLTLTILGKSKVPLFTFIPPHHAFIHGYIYTVQF